MWSGASAPHPDGRQQRMACGAALFTLRLALHRLAVRPIVTLLPDPGQPDLLAVVRHGGTKAATPEQDGLLRAVPLRRTNPQLYSDAEVASPALHALRRAALDEGAWLHFVQDAGQRRALRVMALRAHRAQLAVPAIRAELAAWAAVAPDRPDRVPATASGALPEQQDTWVLRDVTGGAGRSRVTGEGFEKEPLIAVLTSHLAGTMAEVQVGQALQRVLLTAAVNGLATSFLSQVVEVPQTREELRRLIGGNRPPQAVLRIGYGRPTGSTPPRDAEDVLAPAQVVPKLSSGRMSGPERSEAPLPVRQFALRDPQRLPIVGPADRRTPGNRKGGVVAGCGVRVALIIVWGPIPASATAPRPEPMTMSTRRPADATAPGPCHRARPLTLLIDVVGPVTAPPTALCPQPMIMRGSTDGAAGLDGPSGRSRGGARLRGCSSCARLRPSIRSCPGQTVRKSGARCRSQRRRQDDHGPRARGYVAREPDSIVERRMRLRVTEHGLTGQLVGDKAIRLDTPGWNARDPDV